MRILWVNDFPPGLDSLGGAEATMDLLATEGTKRGHDSTYLAPAAAATSSPKDLEEMVMKFDGVVFVNTFFFEERVLKALLGHRPHFNLERDFGFCALRNPECVVWLEGSQLARCGQCPLAKVIFEDVKAHHDIHIEIMQTSVANLFVSPLQFNVFKKCLGDIKEPNYILPPVIDVDSFYPIGNMRQGYLYVGRFSVKKGIMNVIKFAVTNPGDRVILVGFDKETYTFPPNCFPIGRVDHKGMNNIYNSVDIIIVQPEIIETGPRTLLEACLAGCEYVANEKVGILSLDWPFHDRIALRKKLREVKVDFWKIVEGTIK